MRRPKLGSIVYANWAIRTRLGVITKVELLKKPIEWEITVKDDKGVYTEYWLPDRNFEFIKVGELFCVWK